MVALRFGRVKSCLSLGPSIETVCQIWHNQRTVDEPHIIKELLWLGSSRKELKGFPDEVQREIGYALYLAQKGQKALEAKVLAGFGGAGVLR
jgi:hypothetical protein